MDTRYSVNDDSTPEPPDAPLPARAAERPFWLQTVRAGVIKGTRAGAIAAVVGYLVGAGESDYCPPEGRQALELFGSIVAASIIFCIITTIATGLGELAWTRMLKRPESLTRKRTNLALSIGAWSSGILILLLSWLITSFFFMCSLF